MSHYQYFLVSLVPDPVRNERVNIGVIGLYEDKIAHNFLKNPQKIKSISPEYDTSHYPGEGLVQLLSTIPATQRAEFISSLSDEFIRIYPAAVGIAKDYDDFIVAINQISDRLVKPIIKRSSKLKVTKLKTEVRNTFQKKQIISEHLADKRIVTDYPIAEAENLIADFAYVNGTFNIIETLDFRVSLQRIRDKFKETALAAIKIDEARRKIDKDAKGRLLYVPPVYDGEKIAPHQSLLSDYYNRIYNYADKEERAAFFADVDKDLFVSLL